MHMQTPGKNEAGMSYIVRLLHRRNQDEQIVGVVESVENGACHAFIDRDELWAILMRAGTETAGEKKAR
jgi:hypothetical protein